MKSFERLIAHEILQLDLNTINGVFCRRVRHCAGRIKCRKMQRAPIVRIDIKAEKKGCSRIARWKYPT